MATWFLIDVINELETIITSNFPNDRVVIGMPETLQPNVEVLAIAPSHTVNLESVSNWKEHYYLYVINLLVFKISQDSRNAYTEVNDKITSLVTVLRNNLPASAEQIHREINISYDFEANQVWNLCKATAQVNYIVKDKVGELGNYSLDTSSQTNRTETFGFKLGKYGYLVN